MIKVIVLYPQAPDEDAYAAHLDVTQGEVPLATTRHGRIFGSPAGKPEYEYLFEYEFPDMEAFRASGAGLQASAEDAQKLGVPFTVLFADVG